MLRITNNMMVNNLKRNMNLNLLRLNDLETQLATRSKINKPSDDPAGTVKALRLRTNLSESEQYRANINAASSFMETTDDALGSINEVIQKIRELTVKAATGSNSSESELAIANEIAQLNEQLKMVANSTYGSKYIFAGTNVTQAPYQSNTWLGNEEIMEVEIGVGVKIPMNLNVKEFFMGRLNNLNMAAISADPDSKALQGLDAQDLQEGAYALKTTVVGAAADSSVMEAQNYLGSISKNGNFFYQDNTTAASLGVGTGVGVPDSNYNSSLMIEVKKVKASVPKDVPRAALTSSVANSPVLTFNKALYTKDSNGNLVPLATGNIAGNFTYAQAVGSTAALGPANYNSATSVVAFTIGGVPATGDTITWNNDLGGAGNNKVYSADGKEYTPVKAVYNGTNWVYDDNAKLTVDIKGHVYNASNGTYKYVEQQNVELDMETATGQALITIKASAFNNADGTGDPNFAQDLVIWNNGTAALGGIDPTNPQIMVGDKTVISTTAREAAGSDRVDIGYTYLDKNGAKMDEKKHSFAFQANSLDHKSQNLKFFTLNEQTGLSYDGSVTLTTNTFMTTAANKASTFDYQAGLFSYVTDLTRKVEQGKLPQVGNELAGADIRLQELLLYRSTLGARVNRLELQTSRLTSSEESYSKLLAETEDADMAEVIMTLKMQETAYQGALSAGARIIQPTLLDFLR